MPYISYEEIARQQKVNMLIESTFKERRYLDVLATVTGIPTGPGGTINRDNLQGTRKMNAKGKNKSLVDEADGSWKGYAGGGERLMNNENWAMIPEGIIQ